MRRLFPSVAMALFLTVAGCGTERVFPVSGMAEIEPPTIDFGRVALGSTATRELKVRNRGRAPLMLRQFAIEGLGEDIEIVNRGAEQLASGESTVLAVRFSPQIEAILKRNLGLEVSDTERPEVNVPVTGIGVRPRVTVLPESLDFGRIEIGVREQRSVILQNEFDMPVDVRLGRRGDIQYSYEPEDIVTVPPLGSLEVPITFLPARTGRADAQIALMPCPNCGEQGVPMTGVGIDRALIVSPEVIDFGYVPVDRAAVREFTITNAGSHILEVGRMWLDAADEFEVEPETATLAEGQQIAVTIRFEPGSKGEQVDTLNIESSSVRTPVSQVAVRGIGGGPEIKVTVRDGTECIDFGRVPFGSRPHRYLTISNIGADPGAPNLQVTNIYAVPGTSPLFGSDVALPIEIPTGQSVDVAIWYEPNGMSLGQMDQGLIAITSNDGSQPEIRVCTTGSSDAAPPCDGLEIAPSVVDFGSLDLQRGAALSVLIRNVGENACIVRNLGIAAGSDNVFWTHPFVSHTVPPQSWFGWDVYFDPHRVWRRWAPIQASSSSSPSTRTIRAMPCP